MSAQAKAVNDYGAPSALRSVTVFGWSGTQPGTDRWAQAEHLGHLCGKYGFDLVTGGYCGSMEALSKGAREAQQQQSSESGSSCNPAVRGILVPGLFPDRVYVGNKYLTESLDAASLCDRLHHLTCESKYFVVLPGTLGTLTELSVIWSLAMLHPHGLPKPLILALREPWEVALKPLIATLCIPEKNTVVIKYVDTVDEAMSIIVADRDSQSERVASSQS